MKKLAALLTISLMAVFSGNLAAYPNSVTVDGKQNACVTFDTCNEGSSVLVQSFEAGEYIFNVDSGAWSTWTLPLGNVGFEGWLWSMSIYQPSTGGVYDLGDNVNAYVNPADAFDANKNDFTIIDHAGGDLWFYVLDPQPRENTGTVTVAVSIVPEPVSSTLFIAGGGLLVGRRFWKKKKSS